jgi:hypothetical protein
LWLQVNRGRAGLPGQPDAIAGQQWHALDHDGIHLDKIPAGWRGVLRAGDDAIDGHPDILT